MKAVLAYPGNGSCVALDYQLPAQSTHIPVGVPPVIQAVACASRQSGILLVAQRNPSPG